MTNGAAKGQWLDAGLALLADEGYQALRIDRLGQMVGLTKGSFYHHFGGMPGYRTALLAHFEEHATTSFIRIVDARRDTSPSDRLHLLMRRVLAEQRRQRALEVAFRTWAQRDDEALVMQRRLDDLRVSFVRGLLVEAGVTEHDARSTARMIYLIQVGGEHVAPPATAAELRRSWEALLRPLLGPSPIRSDAH